jgi:hypothetical protein
MRSPPAIALQRRQDATAKFTQKLRTLEQLLTEGSHDRFPRRVSVTSFATWTDAELGVLPISRSILYDDHEDYLPLQQRMATLLARMSQLRAKQGKKANLVTDLRKKLEDAEARAQSYIDQYSTAMSELIEARKEIEWLKLKISRQTKNSSKVTPLHVVGNNEPVGR